MNTQQTLAGYKTTKDFVNELQQHLKISKICDEVSDCFQNTINWDTFEVSDNSFSSDIIDVSNIKTAANMGQSEWDTEALGVQFANGTTAILAYNPKCTQNPYSNQIEGTSCLAITYDTSGYKTPNALNKDIRTINARLSKCSFKSNGACFSPIFKVTSWNRQQCLEVNANNELGIPCAYGDSDGLAPAAFACGGIDNVVSKDQLTELYEYLHDPLPNQSYYYKYKLNLDKWHGLGFPYLSSKTNSGLSFWIKESGSHSQSSGFGYTCSVTVNDRQNNLPACMGSWIGRNGGTSYVMCSY